MSQLITTSLKKYIDIYSFPYAVISEKPRKSLQVELLRFDFKGFFPISITANEQQKTIKICSTLPIRAEMKRQEEVEEFLYRINAYIQCGVFMFDTSSKLIKYETRRTVKKAESTPYFIDDLIRKNINMISYYVSAFMEILFGNKTSDEVLKSHKLNVEVIGNNEVDDDIPF